MRSSHAVGIDLAVLPAFVAAPAATDDGKHDEPTNRGCETDNEGFVFVDPGLDFVAHRGVGTLTLLQVRG